jgi:predicted DNA-binding transcriptional regulator AlpA
MIANSEPLLASARELAGLLGLSVRSIRAMNASGRLPAPIRIGAAEILAWIDDGCPSRSDLNPLRRGGA